jgi:hypothetical protein
MEKKGFLVASDQNLEWLLPWWWDRYSSFNSHPVCFVDFGMTKEAVLWCRDRGQVIAVNEPHVFSPLSEEKRQEFEKIYGKSFCQSRQAWLKKPLACSLSPFEQTVWLDLDCEVLSQLTDMFDFLSPTKEMALCFGSTSSPAQWIQEAFDAGTVCNSGVIVFSKKSSLIAQWERMVKEQSEQYFGDECILSLLICRHLDKVSRLPEAYNWRMSRGVPLYAKIIHWNGEWGKQYIAKHGGLQPALSMRPQMQTLFDRI